MQSSLSRCVGPIVAALLIPAALAAQATTEDLPSAEAILDRHVEATGGKKAHLAIKTRKTVGKLVIDMAGHNIDAKVEKHAQAPSNSHVVLQHSLLNQVSVSNGKDAWEWHQGHAGTSGTTELLEGAKKERVLEKSQLHGAVHWRKHYKKVKTIGIVQVAKKPAYEVQVTTRRGTKYSRYYGKESGRLVRYDQAYESPTHGKVQTQVFVQDYRKFDSVWLPTKVHAVVKSSKYGKGTQTYLYSTIEHGVKVSPSLFKIPPELVEQQATKKPAKGDGHGHGHAGHQEKKR